jgi:hypothetical protein
MGTMQHATNRRTLSPRCSMALLSAISFSDKEL